MYWGKGSPLRIQGVFILASSQTGCYTGKYGCSAAHALELDNGYVFA